MPTNDLSTLPVAYPLASAQMVSFFNTTKRDGDWGILPWMPPWIALQPTIQGDYAVVFASEAAAETAVPGISGATYLAYDLEHWTRSPTNEQDDPIGSLQKAVALASGHGLTPVFGPDAIFNSQYVTGGTPTTLYGKRFRVGGTSLLSPALGAGKYIVQGQRLQIISPDAFGWWVGVNADAIRAGNPSAQVWAQVSVDTANLPTVTPQNAIDALNALTVAIDGIVILCTPSTLTGLQSFLTLLGGPSPRVAAT